MIVNKLIVRGDFYQRTLNFSSDLNIISGEKTSGKSLVLSLIDYCLGKSTRISLKVQTELDKHVDYIFLEVEIKEELFTICRSIKKEISVFWIYHTGIESMEEFIPKKLDKKELQSFLMSKLGAIEFTKTKNKVRSNKLTTETISFRDIYRYCFINQHELGTHGFLSNDEPMKKYKNPICFEMIFDLIDFSQNKLQTEIAKIQNEIQDSKKSKENLEGYLDQRGNSNLIELLDRIEELTYQIEKLQKRKKSIVENKNNDEDIEKNNRDYIILSGEIRELDYFIESNKEKINNIQLGIASNNMLLNDYSSELKNIKATEEINYKLKISEHELTCPLCNSKIKNDFHEDKFEKISKENYKSILKDIESKIKMVTKVVDSSKHNVVDLETQINRKNRKRDILLLALNEFSKDVKTPFLPELNSINISISNYDKEREIFLESKRVFNKINEFDITIQKKEKQLDKLKEQLNNKSEKGHEKSKIISELEEEYIRNMKNMKYTNTLGTYIDSKQYIPYYKNASVFEHDSGGLLECMQLSYLNAIITNDRSLYHPKILLLDSISKYFGTNEHQEGLDGEKINDPEVYLNIFDLLKELSSKAQIIVVENTPPKEVNDYVKYTFRSGENGFIDQSKNEFNIE